MERMNGRGLRLTRDDARDEALLQQMETRRPLKGQEGGLSVKEAREAMLALRPIDANDSVELFSVDESHADLLDIHGRRGCLGWPGLGRDVHPDDLSLVQKNHGAVVGDTEDQEAVRCVQTIQNRLGAVVRLGGQMEEERTLERRLILGPERS